MASALSSAGWACEGSPVRLSSASESGDEPEPTWASHRYILPRDLAKAGARTPIALT